MVLEDCPNRPNCVCTLASRPSQKMDALVIRCATDRAIASVVEELAMMPGVQISEQSATYLHATFRSRILRFVDDVEFQVDVERKLLHFRSASRLGYSDLGVNRKRMSAITGRLIEKGDFAIQR